MDAIQKFQDLLKGLFQFETSDLDFGIYRILNYKRGQIEKFIHNGLVNKVETAFAKYKDGRLININQRFEEAKEKVIDQLNPEALTHTGELKEEFRNTKIGKIYLSIKAQKDEMQTIDEIKLQVFNDLYSFFSRFYEEGDFVPQYRYSVKGHKYAIPYNGEEVKLYWANNEQYYTKTGLLFRDYAFKSGHYKIIFRIVSAKEELGSEKATKERFFVLHGENPLEKINNKTSIFHFEYREMSEKEVKSYQIEGGSNTSKQEKINEMSCEEILKGIKEVELKALLGKEHKNGKSLLFYQVSRFTAKNTKDYFIHKNLEKFLSEQLDYFIKAEVISIETLERERFLDKHITRAKVVREIGEDIIDFLSQIEDFQKRLWEKKKFVLKTEYVITTDRVPEEFHQEIWNNKEQKREWKELGFDMPSLASVRGTKTRSNLNLPIDTRYFSKEFKERMLEILTEKADLDGLLDGLLIKSENWQALNLLLGRYKERVQTIYIDPPFNLGTNADFLYNVNYKDSTWTSILENRLRLARNLLGEKGSIFVRCDYNGNMYVRMLMNEVFGKRNFRNEVIINRFQKSSEAFTTTTESLFLYSLTELFKLNQLQKARECIFCHKPLESKWQWAHSAGENKIPRYFIVDDKKVLLYPPRGRHWTNSQEKIDELIKKGRIRINKSLSYIDSRGEKINYIPEKLQDTNVIIDNNWTDLPGYEFGVFTAEKFSTQNSEILLRRVIESTSNEGGLILDFFLGSGTTTAVAHKLGRKWIGIEMGEHFWSVILPRMKRVLAYDKSGISKEKNVKEIYNEKTAGGFFKYQLLEQYDDTLDNIELRENKQAQLKFGDDYLLKYFLDYETRENPSLLNIEHLKNPFSYKLRVNLEEVGEPQEMVVDIPETFNYLLGLKVKKVKTRDYLVANAPRNDKKRKYLFILGEKDRKNIAIVWREYEDKWTDADFKNDKEFIIKELEPWAPQVVYVNGQSLLTPALGKHTVDIRYIEPEFKKLMEG